MWAHDFAGDAVERASNGMPGILGCSSTILEMFFFASNPWFSMTTTTSWLQGNGMGSMGMGSLHQGVMAHTMYQATKPSKKWDGMISSWRSRWVESSVLKMFVKQTCWGICHWPAPCAGDYCSLGQSLGDMKNSEIATKRVEIKPMNHQKMRICSTIQGCRYGKEIKEQWMPQQSMPQMLIGECPNVPNLCPLSGYHLPNWHALGFTPRTSLFTT